MDSGCWEGRGGAGEGEADLMRSPLSRGAAGGVVSWHSRAPSTDRKRAVDQETHPGAEISQLGRVLRRVGQMKRHRLEGEEDVLLGAVEPGNGDSVANFESTMEDEDVLQSWLNDDQSHKVDEDLSSAFAAISPKSNTISADTAFDTIIAKLKSNIPESSEHQHQKRHDLLLPQKRAQSESKRIDRDAIERKRRQALELRRSKRHSGAGALQPSLPVLRQAQEFVPEQPAGRSLPRRSNPKDNKAARLRGKENLENFTQEEMDYEMLMAKVAASYDAVPPGKRGRKGIPEGEDSWNAPILPATSASMSLSEELYSRFKVEKVERRPQGYLMVTLKTRPNDHTAHMKLAGEWQFQEPSIGDYVNVVWTEFPKPDISSDIIVVDDMKNFLVLIPDLLVAPTRVSGTLQCLRRAVLSERVSTYSSSKHSTFGRVRHDLVERGFLPFNSHVPFPNPKFERDYLESVAKEIMLKPRIIEELFQADVHEFAAIEEMRKIMPALAEFQRRFINSPGETVDLGRNESAKATLLHVIATEEEIFSSMWGLKGKPDMLVETYLERDPEKGKERFVSPLELKTGHRVQAEHHAQIILYSLLLADRYRGQNVIGTKHMPENAGLLLHVTTKRNEDMKPWPSRISATASLQGIPRDHGMIAALIQSRNRFAAAAAPVWMRSKNLPDATSDESAVIADLEEIVDPMIPVPIINDEKALIAEEEALQADSQSKILENAQRAAAKRRKHDVGLPPLPPVLKNQNAICETCYEKNACMVFHRAVEKGTSGTSGLSEHLFDELVGHLTPENLAYFKSWNEMIDHESSMSIGFKREIWTLSGPARELRGRCVATLKHVKTALKASSVTSRKFETTFERHHPPRGGTYPPITELSVEVGDFVTISIEKSHFQVGAGVISQLAPNRLDVTCSKPIHFPSSVPIEKVRWRVDRDERFSNMRAMKTNLVSLMGFEQTALRRLIIDLRKPRFIDDEPNCVPWLRGNLDLPQYIWSGQWTLNDVREKEKFQSLHETEKRQQAQGRQVTAISDVQRAMVKRYASLNLDQRRAVSAVFAAKDYICIHGMPGTGKTSTLAFIIQALQVLNCSVLVCAFTNTAVDNLLIKLKEQNVEFLRLGPSDSMHPDVRDHTLEGKTLSVQDLKNYQANPNLVIGSTCFGISSPLIRKKKFDFCIVDEAGQLTQPACIGPISLAKRFVLVGDDRQLPPLVKSEAAKTMGMDMSLLHRLSSAHENAVVQLTYQFRMNAHIMTLANCLVYDQKLKCATPDVANRQLQLSPFPHDDIVHNGPPEEQWLVQVLGPEVGVYFLNTDTISSIGARERRAAPVRSFEQPDLQAGPPSSSSQTARVEDFDYIDNIGFVSQTQPEERSEQNHLISPSGQQGQKAHFGQLENEAEAELTKILVHALIKCGLQPNQIGVISPYRSQLRIISRQLSHLQPELEVQTVDRYQGRDKDCIIVSLVRSNQIKDVGGLLRDWRRINVAFTRAKRKLFVIGSRNTLEQTRVFQSFLEIVDANKWNYNLPNHAHKMYQNL